MPNDVHVTWDGAPQFESDVAKLSLEVEQDDADALEKVARRLVPKVQSIMPKVSGTLAGSVAEQRSGNNVDVTADTPYAGWIEFGGSRGRPYLATGRFLLPTVKGSGSTVQSDLDRQTQTTIGGFRWSHTMS